MKWSSEHLHVFQELVLHPKKLGMVQYVMGLIFFEDGSDCWFQQDGIICHT
jgi:hypothetical protein